LDLGAPLSEPIAGDALDEVGDVVVASGGCLALRHFIQCVQHGARGLKTGVWIAAERARQAGV
jgi:hypothetical protein